jgi:hypothetical protein
VLGLGANDDRVTPGPLARVTRGLDRIACSLKAARGKPRWSAERRARPKRVAAVTSQGVARAAPEACWDGNVATRGAALDYAPVGAPPPSFICPGGNVSCPAVPRTRMQTHRENGIAYPHPRKRGRGNRAKRGGGGAGFAAPLSWQEFHCGDEREICASLSSKEVRRCPRPLHHPALALLAPDGPPPPLSRVRMKKRVARTRNWRKT